jgi:hypothetical protein
MNLDELNKKIDDLEKLVMQNQHIWEPRNHTVFLTHNDWDSIVHSFEFLELPPGFRWELNPKMATAGKIGRWKGVNILIVKELPEGHT